MLGHEPVHLLVMRRTPDVWVVNMVNIARPARFRYEGLVKSRYHELSSRLSSSICSRIWKNSARARSLAGSEGCLCSLLSASSASCSRPFMQSHRGLSGRKGMPARNTRGRKHQVPGAPSKHLHSLHRPRMRNRIPTSLKQHIPC